MGVCVRVYLIQPNGEVERVSSKAFEDFYLREKPALVKYAGQCITVATVFYLSEKRKPIEIIKIDCMRVHVSSSGAPDPAFVATATRLLARQLDKGFSKAGLRKTSESEHANDVIVESTAAFDDRRWSQLHPPLTGTAHKNILADIFGFYA